LAERVEKPPEGLPQGAQAQETYKTSDPRPHYAELDALRGVAILGVVMVHAVNRWETVVQKPLNVPLLNINLLELSVAGSIGLPLFFLLSGYLLAWTESARASKGNYSVRSYALRRVLRIVPAYYFALAIIFLLLPTDPSLTSTLIYLAFLQGLLDGEVGL